MAHLKKGLLGTPKGKIGNIMGYSKNGKGIIQSLPKTTDAYSRYWSLLKWKIEQQLTYVWSILTPTDQAVWASVAPVGLTGLEYMIQWALELMQERKQLNAGGAVIDIDGANGFLDCFVEGNFYEMNATITIPPNDPFWSAAGSIQIIIGRWALTGGVSNLTRIIGPITPQPINVQWSNPAPSLYGFFTLQVRSTSPTLRYYPVLVPSFNPSLELPIT